MNRCCRIDNLPVVLIENFTLLVRQGSIRVVDNEPRFEWNKCRVDMYWVGVTGEVYGVNSMLWKMSFKPFHAAAVGCESVLTEKVFTKSHNISCIKQRLVFIGDEVQICCAL